MPILKLEKKVWLNYEKITATLELVTIAVDELIAMVEVELRTQRKERLQRTTKNVHR